VRAFFDIDTQFDFVFSAGALYGKGGEQVIPQVGKLNRYAASQGFPVISSMCAHPENAREFRDWAPHCVRGTFGQRKPAETLLDNPTQQILIEKDDLDLFSNPAVPELLDRFQIDDCVVYGVFLEYCVKCAVMGLLRSGRRVTLVTDATMPVNTAAGAEVLAAFLQSGAQLTTLREIIL
jgi:nicotinamidase/pyrazinamidase